MSDEEPERRVFASNFGIPLDGQDFSNADVTNNRFVYSGGAPPIFNATVFTGNGIDFQGPAMNTLQFMRLLLSSSPSEDKTVLLRSLGLISGNETVSKAKDG